MSRLWTSLRVRLLLLVVMAVLPAFALLVSAAREQHRLVQGLIEQDAIRIVRTAIARRDDLIGETRQILAFASRIPAAQAGDAAACSRYFQDLLQRSQFYANFGLIRPDGELACSAVPTTERRYVGDRPYFQRAVQTREFAAGDFVIGRETGKPNLTFASPAFDESGSLTGVVFAALDLTWLNDFAQDITLPDDAIITVFDSQGTILARHPDPDRWVGVSARDTELYKTVTSGPTEGTVLTTGMDGIERLYEFAPLYSVPGGGRAYAAIGIPMATSLAIADEMLLRNLIILALVACLAAAAAWYGSDLLVVRQVRALARATERVASGDLAVRVGATSAAIGELGQLGESFDRMTGALEEDRRKRLAAEAERERLLLREREARAELERAQSQLVQQERLRALGEMASGVAHDFNNALVPIVGYTELLLLRPEPMRDPALVGEYLKRINVAAEDAASVVGRLREFYRGREAHEHLQAIDLPMIVEQVVELTRPRWREQSQAKGVQIEVRTDLEPVRSINGNPAELREVITNLLFNAMDAMPTGGSISIAVRNEGTGILLSVADTGSGMSEEVRRRCLEPFFTTKGEQGTGLGLAMVYGILKRHGAELNIASSPGHGTTFSIRFLEGEQGQVRQLDQSIAPAPGSLHVLVVDDDDRVSELTAAYLMAAGHTSAIANDTTKALQMFQSEDFDLVVTDQAMRVMSGEQLALAIKETSPTTPVILLTGFGMLMQAAEDNPDGVDAILAKPAKLMDLQNAIASVFGR